MELGQDRQPLVSVVMPVYNVKRFLRQAIESVLNQTYRNIELIMVDDCSTDGSLEIMLGYEKKDDRVRTVKGEKNQGVACVRNRGIQLAKGKYIALLDSDDVWEKTKIERQVRLLQAKNADIVYCSMDFIDENGNEIKKPFIVPEEIDYKRMLYKCVFSCSTIMAKTRLLQEHPFRTESYIEDVPLWIELMALPVKAAGDKTVLMHYRQVTGSRANNKLKQAKRRWKLYREALGMSIPETCVVFVKYAFWGVVKYYT